jgi:hypothetical protein
MLKQELILAYKTMMQENGWTYKEVCDWSLLTQTQLNNILNHNARKVSIEKMEEGMRNLGFVVTDVLWGDIDDKA